MSDKDVPLGLPYPGLDGPVADLFEPLRCYRTFRAPLYGEIRSLHFEYTFHAGVNEAQCLRHIFNIRRRGITRKSGPDEFRADANGTRPEPDGAAPGPSEHSLPNCSCGFYCYHSATEESHSGPLPSVGAVVDVWGTVVVGSLGCRASHLRIVALVLPPVQEEEPGPSDDMSPTEHFQASLRQSQQRSEFRLGLAMSIAAREQVAADFPLVPVYATKEAALADFPLSGPPSFLGGAS